MTIAELDDLIATIGLNVREETLEEAWGSTAVTEHGALAPEQVLAVITLRARPGLQEQLGAAARAFVEASLHTPTAISSSLHRSMNHPDTWFLVERFASEAAFSGHMASDYFQRFRSAQVDLIAEPVRATFLARGTRPL
jgi:quinol monooxygenase YgiN